MKYLLSVVLFMSLLSFASAQDANCLKGMHKGTFTYEGHEKEVTVKRTKKKQIEIFNGGKTIVELKITWLNDSTYVLTYVKTVNLEETPCWAIGSTVTTEITACDGEKATCNFTTAQCGSGSCVMIKLK